MRRWHITRQWRKLDSLRAFWYKLTFRPRLALAVLFRMRRISILHNYDVKGSIELVPTPGTRCYISHCYFNHE